MIEVHAVTKTYGSRPVLKGLSLTVERGRIAGFLGVNGAGKTTSLDIICGCRGADSGTVRIAGHDISKAPLSAKSQLGYLPDVPPLHPEMTVGENIEFAAQLHRLTRQQRRERVGEVVARLQLGDVTRTLAAELSKGYRQRVALAQALVHKPPVLVLDEPTDGLDPHQLLGMRQLIKELASEHTILLSSHQLSEVELLCERIHILAAGRITAVGSYAELQASMAPHEVYELQLARDVDGFMASLPPITGLESVDVQAGLIHLHLSSQASAEGLDRITHHAVAGNYGLRGLRRKSLSLEEVFLNVMNTTTAAEVTHG